MADTPIENPVGAEDAKPALNQEQLLSGLLTVLTYRMGGRVVFSHVENRRVFERLQKKNQVITMRATKTEIILELTRIAQPVVQPEPATIDSKES